MLFTAKQKLYQTLADIIYTDTKARCRQFNKGIVEYNTYDIIQLAEQHQVSCLGINPKLLDRAFSKIANATLTVYYEGGAVFRIVLRSQF